jgi:hypothetical protein
MNAIACYLPGLVRRWRNFESTAYTAIGTKGFS